MVRNIFYPHLLGNRKVFFKNNTLPQEFRPIRGPFFSKNLNFPAKFFQNKQQLKNVNIYWNFTLVETSEEGASWKLSVMS